MIVADITNTFDEKLSFYETGNQVNQSYCVSESTTDITL